MEVAQHQNGQCLECRVDKLEELHLSLSRTVAWVLIGAWVYFLYKSNLINLEMFHG